MKTHLLHVVAYKNMNMHYMLNPVFNYNKNLIYIHCKITAYFFLARGHVPNKVKIYGPLQKDWESLVYNILKYNWYKFK